MSLLQRLPAKKLALIAAIALVVFPLAIIAARIELWHFRTSFLLFALATLVAFVVFVVSVLKLPKALKADRKALMVSILLALVPIAIMGQNVFKANKYPFIHDITTDTQNPPVFVAANALRSEEEHDLTYAGQELADQQLVAYPNVTPLLLALEPNEVFAKAKALMIERGWEIVAEQSDTIPFTLEAVDTTALMGFKDDIIVRISGSNEDSQSTVDMRSMSRQGKSDLGKNAARIHTFLRQL